MMDPPWAVVSPILAAGLPLIRTVEEPLTMESGGPTQVHMSPTVAAGKPPIRTVGAPGPVIGPPTWGTGPGFIIGHVCMSVKRAAGGIAVTLRYYRPTYLFGLLPVAVVYFTIGRRPGEARGHP